MVLLCQDLVQAPRLESGDSPQLALLVKKVAEVLPGLDYVFGDFTQELDDVGQVVLVPGILLPGVGLEEVVAGGQLERHARHAPDVRRGAVARTQQNLHQQNLICTVKQNRLATGAAHPLCISPS